MSVEFYADYVRPLRTLFAELDQHPEWFQTYDVHIELAASGKLVVYETKRQKGQTDSLYYGRSGPGDSPRQIAQAAAFAAIDHFMALSQFLAFNGKLENLKGEEAAQVLTIGSQYPSCAIRFAYRKKGQPNAKAMFMIFVGFNDDHDADEYVAKIADPATLVDSRPLRGDKVYEWK
ncbi:hypothetical protein C0075_03435 [Rhizobium sp. KAs_5_22]|uniref:hypothetical protein n=1 Tax=Ciceribacter selenitireducens TaxID=448181 RepID=UPI000491DA32|nr:hypothetical protein [Ciceribacter selenitireducens]PPJ48918.1 hypothetical protein C0075_03435 [Rhizobium sp. KAs_5_22]